MAFGKKKDVEPDTDRINPDEGQPIKDNGDLPPDMEELPITPTGYAAEYKKAKEKGTLKRRTSRIFSWGIDGDDLVGKILAVKPFEGGKFDQKCNQYLMETDQGNVSFLLGAYTDSLLESEPITNRIVHISYSGQKELEDKRRVNMFDVDVID